MKYYYISRISRGSSIQDSNKSETFEEISANIDDIELRMIDILKEFGIMRGRSPNLATIAALFHVFPEITQKFIRVKTGFSMGAISSYLKDLEAEGYIQKRRNQKSPEWIYSMAGDSIQVGIQSSKNVVQLIPQMNRLFEAINADIKNLKGDDLIGSEMIVDFMQLMIKTNEAYTNAIRNYARMAQEKFGKKV